MALFRVNGNNKLAVIKEKPFRLESELQLLTEQNLNNVFGLEFVKHEFSLNSFRIDTLAFDKETKAFVIIEYKRDKNFSVIDQGYAYLALMLNNKADFILEYNECKKDTLRKADIDWSQSRVLFVSQSFTAYQKEAINFKDLPIELWEIKRYDNETVNYNQIKTSGSKESIKTISKEDQAIENVTREIKVYTEDEHLSNATEQTKELYEIFRSAILNLGDIEIQPKKYYIAFKSASNVVDIHILKNSLKLWINLKKEELDDPKNISKDVSSTGHWGNGDYEISLRDDEDLEYILSLIKQSLKANKK